MGMTQKLFDAFFHGGKYTLRSFTMRFYWLILGILAVWRITHLFQAEDGPWDVVVRLRRSVGNGLWGKLLDCFYCLSAWVSAPLAWWIGESWRERALLWLSFSAGASLLEKATTHRVEVPPAPFVEEPAEGESYGMLRTKEKPGSPGDEPRPTESESAKPESTKPGPRRPGKR